MAPASHPCQFMARLHMCARHPRRKVALNRQDSRREGVNPIRIHLGPMPEMLRTIVGDLLGREQDILVVGRSHEGEDTLRKAKDEQADVLITHEQESEHNLCLGQILAATPLSILSISGDGRTADAVDLVRRPVTLNGGSASALADAVRIIADYRNLSGPDWQTRRPA